MRDIVLVAIGGALGSVSRFGVTLLATRIFGRGFPWGTLAVNVVGCFAIGIVLRFILRLESLGDATKPQVAIWLNGVAVGFLGGLTTFSTFSADTVAAFHNDRPGVALLNIATNVMFCLMAVWAGMAMVGAPEPNVSFK